MWGIPETLLVSAASGIVGGVVTGHLARLEWYVWRHRRLVALALKLRALLKGETVVIVRR